MVWKRRGAADPASRVLAEIGLRAIVDAAPGGLIVFDGEGRVVYRNTAATRTMEELVRRGGDRREEVVRQLTGGASNIIRGLAPDALGPHTATMSLEIDGHRIDVRVTIVRLDRWYLLQAQDVTDDVQNGRLLSITVKALQEASTALRELGDQLGTDAERVTGQAASVAGAADELTTNIREISASTSSAVGRINSAVEAAETVSATTSRLQESTTRIDVVSRLINGIAEQTNLLALNATIEAARAGDLGKGFAVVAGEVKELARRTSHATGQIAAMIAEIQAQTGEATTSIATIVELIGQMQQQQETIAGAMEEQSATANEISRSSSEVATAMESTERALTRLRELSSAVAHKAAALES